MFEIAENMENYHNDIRKPLKIAIFFIRKPSFCVKIFIRKVGIWCLKEK